MVYNFVTRKIFLDGDTGAVRVTNGRLLRFENELRNSAAWWVGDTVLGARMREIAGRRWVGCLVRRLVVVPSIEEGRIVLIANPVSKSGRGAVAASEAARLLRERVGQERFEMLTTAWAGHGESLARELGPDVGCVIALGGDGLVNEVVNGLMARAPEDRPALAVVPVGSGNDYAETLGMAYSVPTAVTEILRFQTTRADVGRVNGRYFAETLSFGLDAAIALIPWIAARSPGTRAPCSIESAVDQLFHHFCGILFQDERTSWGGSGCAPHPEWDDAYLVAVQGAHLRRPLPHHAQGAPDDGLLDICWATRRAFSPWRALALLLRAWAASTRATTTFTSGGRPPSCSTSRRSRRPRWMGSPSSARTLSSTASPTPSRSWSDSGRAKKKKAPSGGLMNIGGALDRIRTCGTLLRRQVLHPLSYEGTNFRAPDRRVLRYYRGQLRRTGRQIRKIPLRWNENGTEPPSDRYVHQER